MKNVKRMFNQKTTLVELPMYLTFLCLNTMSSMKLRFPGNYRLLTPKDVRPWVGNLFFIHIYQSFHRFLKTIIFNFGPNRSKMLQSYQKCLSRRENSSEYINKMHSRSREITKKVLHPGQAFLLKTKKKALPRIFEVHYHHILFRWQRMYLIHLVCPSPVSCKDVLIIFVF